MVHMETLAPLLLIIALPLIALFGIVLVVCWILEAINYVSDRFDTWQTEKQWKERQKSELEHYQRHLELDRATDLLVLKLRREFPDH